MSAEIGMRPLPRLGLPRLAAACTTACPFFALNSTASTNHWRGPGLEHGAVETAAHLVECLTLAFPLELAGIREMHYGAPRASKCSRSRRAASHSDYCLRSPDLQSCVSPAT